MSCLVAVAVNAQTAITFDGVDDQINFSTSTPFNVTGNVTVEAKVKMNTVLDYQAVVTNMDLDVNSIYRGYWLGTDDEGYGLWFIGDTTAVEEGDYLYSKNLIDDGAYHHLAGVVKGDSAFLYVDGTLDTVAYIQDLSLASTGLFQYGNDVEGYLYVGDMDDVRFWNVARTAAEIALYKDSCLSGSETGLVAHHHFELGTGTGTVHDLTSNGNDGALSNMDIDASWVAGVACTQPVVTSIATVNNKEAISIYPNPNNGALTVSLNGLSNANISIYNVTGKLVYKARVNNASTHKIN